VAVSEAAGGVDEDFNPDDIDFGDSPAIRSVGAGLVPEAQRPSLEALEKAVDEALAKFAHKPKVNVLESGSDLFPNDEPGATMGVVFKGEIYLFRDALTDLDAANDTLWHELLHYGIRRFLTNEQYSAARFGGR
jgi:hypothetical protein